MNIRAIYALFFISFFHSSQGDVTIRFEGRNEQEKKAMNEWLSNRKERSSLVLVAAGMNHLGDKEMKELSEGKNFKLPFCATQLLITDDTRVLVPIKDNHTYVIRFKDTAKHEEELLINKSPKHAQSKLCVEEITPHNS